MTTTTRARAGALLLGAVLAVAGCGGKKKDGSGGGGGGGGSGPVPLAVETSSYSAGEFDERIKVAVSTEPRAMVAVTLRGMEPSERKSGDADGAGKLTVEFAFQPAMEGRKLEFEVVAKRVGEPGKKWEETSKTVPLQRGASLQGGACRVRSCRFQLGFGAMSVSEIAAGTVVEVGTQKVTSTGDRALVPTDALATLIDKATVAALAPRTKALGISEKLPIAITFPDGVRLQSTYDVIDLHLPALLRAALLEVRQGPVSLGAAADAGGGKRGLLLVDDGPSEELWGFGSLATLGEVDLVAIRKKTTRESSCGTYVGASGSATSQAMITDEDITVYERRTGKTVAHKFFKGVADCKKVDVAVGGVVQASGGAGAASQKWLESQVK